MNLIDALKNVYLFLNDSALFRVHEGIGAWLGPGVDTVWDDGHFGKRNFQSDLMDHHGRTTQEKASSEVSNLISSPQLAGI